MKFGANTFIWADHFGRDQFPLLETIKRAGFDGIEIPLFAPDRMHDREIRRTIEQHGLECTVCSVIPAGLHIASEDSGIRRRTVEHFRACIETTAEMGSKVIAGPLYAPVGYFSGGRRTVDEWKRAVECYQQLGPSLEKFGVTLAIEPLNRYETYFLNTAADAVQLCREIGHPKIGILFDTYHANIEEKNVATAIHEAGSHLRHFHSCENDRGVPGSGHIDWAGVFRALRQAQYDGWLTIESFGFSLGALSAAASIWRDLAPSAEDIAVEGVRFLKGMADAS
ncbi:MAG TPA: sugar phosphate isomerase/epimerase family protein [Bryobacteraceae bacterium]